MTFNAIYTEAEELARETLLGLPICSAAQAGLDPRAGLSLFIGDDFIAISEASARALNYYGGFEYVDAEAVMQIGGYIFYSCEDSRVAEHHAKAVFNA